MIYPLSDDRGRAGVMEELQKENVELKRRVVQLCEQNFELDKEVIRLQCNRV